jgi:hypothetical protein
MQENKCYLNVKERKKADNILCISSYSFMLLGIGLSLIQLTPVDDDVVVGNDEGEEEVHEVVDDDEEDDDDDVDDD